MRNGAECMPPNGCRGSDAVCYFVSHSNWILCTCFSASPEHSHGPHCRSLCSLSIDWSESKHRQNSPEQSRQRGELEARACDGERAD